MREGWLTVSLAEKVPEQLLKKRSNLVTRLLAADAEGLRVKWESTTSNQWLDVRATGDDAEVFSNLLARRFGERQVQLSKVERWDLLKGFITGAGKIGFGVYVDVGVSEPVSKDALYPLHRMRAQLADGEAKPCREILQENSLVDGFPLMVQVTNVEAEKITVELSDETRSLLLSWRKLPFDRVLAIGVGKEEAEFAAMRSGLQYDVIDVEALSPLVQCLVCKIGTDAPGIIAKIGHQLAGARLASFRTPLRLRSR